MYFKVNHLKSKPLFHSNNLLTVHNLYKYHCRVEIFKEVKLYTHMSINELMKHSDKQVNYFIGLPPSFLFDYQASILCVATKIVKKISPSQNDKK